MQKEFTGCVSAPPPFAFMNWANYLKWLGNKWFELVMIILILQVSIAKDISISFQVGNSAMENHNSNTGNTHKSKLAQPIFQKEENFKVGAWLDKRKKANKSKKVAVVPKAQHFSNLTFIMSPTYADRKGIPASIVNQKVQNCLQYVNKYASTALQEQEKYGILASITLAQGLLESNAGDSRLAKESLNHFGIKCRRKCRGCTCRNYHDDDIYDMFRVFSSPVESYREHSILLNTKRYRHLKNYGKDYKKWAFGLKKAGYATDRRYAEKLVRIIEALRLYEYD